MSNKLKIYACTGIGAATQPDRYNYWLDNTSSVENTQAVNNLLRMINHEVIQINYLDLPESDIRGALRRIDVLAVALYYANEFKDNAEELEHVGRIIGRMCATGVFDFESLDNDERDEHLDEIFDQVASALNKDEEGKISETFMEWWEENVTSRNKRAFSEQEAKQITAILAANPIRGIGAVDWSQNKDLAQYFNDCGGYFLYTYFTDAQLKRLPYLFTRKAKFQRARYNECKELYAQMGGSEEEMRQVISDGIITQYKETPEQVCADIIAGAEKSGKIGLTEQGIIAIVTAVITAVISAILGIVKVIANKKKKELAAVDQAAIEANGAYPEDFEGLTLDNNGLSALFSGTSLWVVIGLGAGLLWFMNRNN